MAVASVKDSEFKTRVLEAKGPVMVDFWAEWCGPCKAMMPAVEEAASELDGQVEVIKVNIDESPEAPTKFNVRGIPTFMIFRDGQVVETRVGGMSKSQLMDWIRSAI